MAVEITLMMVKWVQFLPVVDGEGKEKELITNVMRKVLAENDFSGLDVNKVKIRSIVVWLYVFFFKIYDD